MKNYIKNLLLSVLCIAAVAILWNQSHIHWNTEKREEFAGSEMDAEEITFPETYTKKVNETFSIDAKVVVPEDFKSGQLYHATAKVHEFDKEKWKNYLLDGNMENVEYEEDPFSGTTREGDGTLMEMYQTDDGAGLYLSSQEVTYYRSNYFDLENCLEYDYWSGYYNEEESLFSKTADLKTISKTEAWEGLMKEVKELGIISEGFETKDFYALDNPTLQQTEQKMLENGDLEQDELKEKWSGDDEAYYYCLLQKEQGLPLYYSGKVRDYMDDIWSGAVTAYYGPSGLISLKVNYIFDLKYGKEKFQLAPFKTIADTLVKKYEQVIMEEEGIVTECKLFLYPLYIDEGIYDVIPVWICKVEYKDVQNVDYIPVHAVTGEEVLEME